MLPEVKDPEQRVNVALAIMKTVAEGLCSICRALVADRINLVGNRQDVKYAEKSVGDVQELARHCPGE